MEGHHLQLYVATRFHGVPVAYTYQQVKWTYPPPVNACLLGFSLIAMKPLMRSRTSAKYQEKRYSDATTRVQIEIDPCCYRQTYSVFKGISVGPYESLGYLIALGVFHKLSVLFFYYYPVQHVKE